MKYISCFSGIEAASVACKDLGWEPVAFSEIDKFASSVLAHHYPNVPNLGDITKINWRDFHDKSIGLVCGGSPCQAFSVAGLRKSLDDPRGNLTLEFMRAVHQVKPKWIMWENVPGTFSAKGNPFGAFLAGLAGYESAIEPTNGKWANSGMLVSAGEEYYSLAWRVLDAQYFGVPQRRRRIFLVGHIGTDVGKPCEVLLEREGERRDFAKSREARKETSGDVGECFAFHVDAQPDQMRFDENNSSTLTASQHAGACYGIPGNWIGRKPENGGNAVEPMMDISPCLTKMDRHGVWIGSHWDNPENPHPTITQSHYNTSGIGASNQELFSQRVAGLVMAHGQGGAEIRQGQAPCLTCNHEAPIFFAPRSPDGSPGVFNKTSETLNTAQGGQLTPCVSFAQNQCGELRTAEVANTVTTTGNANARGTGKLLSGSTVRRLTPTECERLQGFPDNYTKIPYRSKLSDQCPDGPRYKALGNSWAVPCARWIFERIEKVSKV